MRKALVFLAAGLTAGFALSAWVAPGTRPATTRAADSNDPLAERVATLERTLESERRQREALAGQVAQLRDLVKAAGNGASSRSAAATDPSAATGAGNEASGAAATAAEEAASRRFRGRFGGADGEQARVDQLVAAGFSAERAAYIERRASELRMQALEAQYQARRSGGPIDPRGLPSTEQSLREELGDADYERYLTALGRPTSVGVGGVLASSPAEQAGLQPGDEITSYAGQRVFNLGDLNRLTYQGQPGETVPVDVIRNGEPLEVYVPRGPIGIEGGRFGPGTRRPPPAATSPAPGR